MVLVAPKFIDEVLWPEYLEYSSLLQDLILDVVDTVITKIDQGLSVTPSADAVNHEAIAVQVSDLT